MTSRTFSLRAVISYTHGVMFSYDETSDILEFILHSVLGEERVSNESLVRMDRESFLALYSIRSLREASLRCKQVLLKQFPQLKQLDLSDLTEENAEEWLQRQIDLFGNEFVVVATK